MGQQSSPASSSPKRQRSRGPQQRHKKPQTDAQYQTGQQRQLLRGQMPMWKQASRGKRILAPCLELLVWILAYVVALHIMDLLASLVICVTIVVFQLYLFAKGSRIGKYLLGLYIVQRTCGGQGDDQHTVEKPKVVIKASGFWTTFARESMIPVSLMLDWFLFYFLETRLCDYLLKTAVMEKRTLP